MYDVEILETSRFNYKKSRSFTGRIHPWHDDGTHRTTGIIRIFIPNKELLNSLHSLALGSLKMQQKFLDKVESIPISTAPKIATLLKQFPVDWVNGIYVSLHLKNGLSKRKRLNKYLWSLQLKIYWNM